MATNELGLFLSARRAARSPHAAGLRWSGVRRVPGLRREEVAMLAGVSIDYYTRLEQGREQRPSASVVHALSRALDLAPDTREHLFRLSGATPGGSPAPLAERVDPSLAHLLDAWPDTPALILNRRLDLLALNPLARALYSPFQDTGNLARMVFIDPAGAGFFDDWERSAHACVANLRLALGFDPYDGATLALVDDLRTDGYFRALWDHNDARGKTQDAKVFVHPAVGPLTLEFHSFDVRGAAGQQLIVYRAEPASASHDALKLLATIAATRAAVAGGVESESGRQPRPGR